MARVVDSEQFKASMGKLPTGVTVISTVLSNELFGFTANSFTSVSLKPPLVSFCLNKAAGSLEAFRKSSNFAVSVLAENQSVLAKHFSTGQSDKFHNQDYQLGSVSNCPLINGAICWIECEKVSEYNGGDHIIFIGKVIKVKINNNLKPLIYFARGYRNLNDY